MIQWCLGVALFFSSWWHGSLDCILDGSYDLCTLFSAQVCASKAICWLCLVAQLCLTLCNPTDCSLPGSSVHGFSRQEHWSGLPCPPPGIFPTRDLTQVSRIADRVFTVWTTRDDQCPRTKKTLLPFPELWISSALQLLLFVLSLFVLFLGLQFLVLLSSTNCITPAFILASGHLELEIKTLPYCILYSTVV